jgi:hypothetical protein
MAKAWFISAIAAGLVSLVAPNMANADDRDAISSTNDGKVEVLGWDICFVDARNTAACDVTLPLAEPAERITLADTTLCIGGDAGTAGCDYRLPEVAYE